MKNISKLLAISVIVLMTSFTTKVMAQGGAGYTLASNNAGAKIITPITLTNPTSLNFGSMSVLAATGGTCVLTTIGGRSATGGVNLSSLLPIAANAVFTVTGQASTGYAITLPASITVTETVGTVETMTISSLRARPASAAVDQLTGITSSGGTEDFTIGGTLNVDPGQAGGVYSGTYSVTVAYN